MNAEKFGSMIPVCTGRLVVGGRELVAGEAVPEVWDWPQHMQQLHVKSGNLAFVTREQAEEMGKDAERTRTDGFRKDVRNRLSKAEAAHAQQISKMKQIEEQRAAQALEVERTRELVAAARKLVAEVDGKETADEMWDQLKPVKVKTAPVAKPTAADVVKQNEKKAEAQKRLNEMVAELATTEQLDIQTQFAKMTYSDLLKTARETYKLEPGKVSKNALLKLVEDAAKLQAVEEKRDEAAKASAAELAETLGEQE